MPKFKALSRIKSGGRVYEAGCELVLEDERDIARLRVAPVAEDAGEEAGKDEAGETPKKAAKKKAARS